MQILPVPIQQLLSSIINTGGAVPASNSQCGGNEVNIFDRILSGKQQSGDMQLLDNPEMKTLLMQSLENPEIAEQIKTALAGGGKLSLQVNNPGNILAGLLSVVNQLNPSETTTDIRQPELKIDVESLLNSLKIKEVVVDTESAGQVVDKFMEQLNSLFDNIVEVARSSDISNIDELVTTLKNLGNEIERSLTDLVQPETKDVKIDFSKIKVIIPPGQNKELFGIDSDKPVTIIESEPVQPIVVTPEAIEQIAPIESQIVPEQPVVPASETEENVVVTSQVPPQQEVATTEEVTAGSNDQEISDMTQVLIENSIQILNLAEPQPVVIDNAEVLTEETESNEDATSQPCVEVVIDAETQPLVTESEAGQILQPVIENTISILPQPEITPVITEITGNIEVSQPVTQETPAPTAAIVEEESTAIGNNALDSSMEPVIIPVATIISTPLLEPGEGVVITPSNVTTETIKELAPTTGQMTPATEQAGPTIISTKPLPENQINIVANTTKANDVAESFVNPVQPVQSVQPAMPEQPVQPVVTTETLENVSVLPGIKNVEVPIQPAQALPDSQPQQPVIQPGITGMAAPITPENPVIAKINNTIPQDVIATMQPVENIEITETPAIPQPVENIESTETQAIPRPVENIESTETPAIAQPVENSQEKEGLTTVPITRTVKEALDRIIAKVMEKINPTRTEAPQTDVVINAGQNVINDTSEVSLNQELLEKISRILAVDPEVLDEIEVKVEPAANMIKKLDKALDQVVEKLQKVISKEILTGGTGEIDIQKIDKIVKANLTPIIAGAKVVSENNEIKISLPGLIKAPEVKNAEAEIAPAPVNTEIKPEIKSVSQEISAQTKQQPVVTPQIETEILETIPVKPEISKTEQSKPQNNPILSSETAKEGNIPKQVKPASDQIEQNIEQKTVLANNVNVQKTRIDRTIDINKAVITLNEQINKPSQKIQPGSIYYDPGDSEKVKPLKEEKRAETKAAAVKNGLSNLSNNMFELFMNNSSDPAIMALRTAKLNQMTINSFNINDNHTARNADSVVNQVIEKLRSNFEKNEIRIALTPNHLGKVDVSVTMQRGVIVAHIITETARAMESLKSGAESLKQVLVESGVNVDKIVVQTSEKSTFTGSNNNNSDQNSNAYRDNANNPKDANSNANQHDRSNAKEAMDLSQFKQSQNNRYTRNTGGDGGQGLNQNANQADTSTSKSKQTEANYINTEKGRVNYRV